MKEFVPRDQSGHVVESQFFSFAVVTLSTEWLAYLTAAATTMTNSNSHHQTSKELELEKTAENIKY